MSIQHQNNFFSFLFWVLIGSRLNLIFNQKQSPKQTSRFPLDGTAANRAKEYARAQSILQMTPHTLGESFISLN